MLETVREFGRMQLVGAGEDVAARDGAPGLGPRATPRRYAARPLVARGQVAAVRAIAVEENNLADALRAAVAVPDPAATAELDRRPGRLLDVARREHPGHRDGRGRRRRARRAGSRRRTRSTPRSPPRRVTALNTMVGEIADAPTCLALLATYGDRTTDPRATGLVAVLAAQDPDDPDGHAGAAARDRRRRTATTAQSVAIARLLVGALPRERRRPRACARARRPAGWPWSTDDDGPWIRAMMHSIVGGLNAQLGKRAEAAEHARAAIPILDALEANDDAIQARSLLAGHAIAEGRFDEARAADRRDRAAQQRPHAGSAAPSSPAPVRAELALARGDVDEGLRLYRVAGKELRQHHGCPGMELDRARAVVAVRRGRRRHGVRPARHRSGGRGPLRGAARQGAARSSNADRPRMDYPVAGMVLHGLGTWGLLKGRRWIPRTPIRLPGPRRAVRLPAVHGDHGPGAHRRGGRAGRARPGRPAPRRSTASAGARTSCRRPGPSPSGSLWQ